MENTPEKKETSLKTTSLKGYTVFDLVEKRMQSVRDVWENEALDFTMWMKDPKVIEQLGNAIDLHINLDPAKIKSEQKGSQSNRRCDIVAEIESDEEDDDPEIVVIENQLEKTDFSHLGRIILYAATHGANHVVWVVKEATPDHQKTIEWLNENTSDDLRFYLVEFEAYAYGEKKIATLFRLIEGPDEEQKATHATKPGRKAKYKFWKGFIDYVNEENIETARVTRQASPENWYGVSIGTSKCHINLEYSKRQVKIVVLTEDRERHVFKKLEEKLADMKKAVGEEYRHETSDEGVKQPLFRFFGPKCDIEKNGDNGVRKAYCWLAKGLSNIVPIVQSALNIR